MSEKKIVVPPDIRIILDKPGRYWTEEEIVTVKEWLLGEPLDVAIRIAYTFTRDLDLAKQVTRTRIKSAFQRLGAYDPAHHQGRNNAFLNWLYTMIARAALQEATRKRRAM